jgi:hypothetical protein
MSQTRGLHWIVTTHGTWLHGDPRGSWHRGRLIGPDPFLEQSTRSRMTADAVVLDVIEQQLVAATFGTVVAQHSLITYSATIHATHAHVVFAPFEIAVEQLVATLKYRSARAVKQHRLQLGQATSRSVWTKGQFVRYLLDDEHVYNAIEYVRQHNVRANRPVAP